MFIFSDIFYFQWTKIHVCQIVQFLICINSMFCSKWFQFWVQFGKCWSQFWLEWPTRFHDFCNFRIGEWRNWMCISISTYGHCDSPNLNEKIRNYVFRKITSITYIWSSFGYGFDLKNISIIVIPKDQTSDLWEYWREEIDSGDIHFNGPTFFFFFF